MKDLNIIKEKKLNIYSSFFSNNYASKFFFKSILHHVISLEIYENNNASNEIRARSSPRESNPRRRVEVNNERAMCTICLDFVDDNTGRTLPCMHRFHEPCISRWLRTRPHCSVCRRRVNGRNARAHPTNRVRMTNSSRAIIRDARRQVSDYQRRNRRREYNRIYAGSRVGLIG